MVFYFTGTGNSLYAAKMLDSDYRSIPQLIQGDDLTFKADCIGVVCPIYGHEMPAMVKDFLRRATFRTGFLYVVLTYGNRHANAVELAQQALVDAGKTADYIATLLMVDNFLSAFDMDEQTKLDKGVEGHLDAIKADIAAGRHRLEGVTQADRLAHEGYLQLVHRQPETIWTDFDFTDNCVGCGICTKVCPAGCIHIQEQKAVRTGTGCQACYACIHACPKGAIWIRETLGFKEKNPKARYRNEHVSLCELITANNQTKRT